MQDAQLAPIHAARIGFDGDFGVGGDIEPPLQVFQNLGKRFTFQESRCAPTEEEGGDTGAAIGALLDLAMKSLHKGGHNRPTHRIGVEVAIATFAVAERDVDIKPQRFHRFQDT
jgi:hypothetical protein